MIKCLFLVEGPYDLLRLSLLKRIFDESKLEIVPLEGDKLTDSSYSRNFGSIIKKYLQKVSTHDIKDFDLLAQICDMDGCYIDDSLVKENSTIKDIKYYRDHIDAKDAIEKVKLNEVKRKNIDGFLKNGKIELYYNSTNIDDVYDNNQNPSKKQKKSFAIQMYQRYEKNLKGFIDAIFHADKSHTKDFEESWSYITFGVNSLNSTSNLKYFLIKHINELKSEYKFYVAEKLM